MTQPYSIPFPIRRMTKPRNEKIEFRGTTEEGVREKFRTWRQRKAASAWNIVEHPIRELSLRHHPKGFPYRPVRLHAFYMMIEYETNERKPKRSKE
jgi:hypothetical protein